MINNIEIKNSDESNDNFHEVENHFEGIREKIRTELKNAKENILVAVGWFTDISLLDTLIQQARKGIIVKILLANDEHNKRVDFSELENANGKVWFIPREENHLMHHKFCVIDLNTCIIGSYNFTFNAQGSEENITIIRNNIRTATEYKDRFIELRNKYYPDDPLSIKYKNNGEFIDGIYFKALEKVKENDLEKAIELFSQVIEHDDRFYPAIQNRASLKAMSGDIHGALADFIKVLLIQPQNTDALKSLGGVFYQLADYKNAMTCYTKAINFAPFNSDLHYERGRFKMLLKDYLGAVADLKTAIELNPNDTEAIGDYNECLAFLNEQ